MPDANGAFKGAGWSRRREASWQRVFDPEADVHRALVALHVRQRAERDAKPRAPRPRGLR